MSLYSANRGAAVVVAIVLAITPVLQALPQTPAKTPPPKAPPAKAQAATPAAVDGGWPRNYATSQGRLIVYEPQIASWANQKQMVAFAATSYQSATAAATAKPALGTIKLEAATSVSLDERLVHFGNLRITESNFPTRRTPRDSSCTRQR